MSIEIYLDTMPGKACPASKLCTPCLPDRVCRRKAIENIYSQMEVPDLGLAIEKACSSNEAYKNCPNLNPQTKI